MKRRITVLALAMVLVLALSTFTRAANYVGLGIGIVGQAAEGCEPAGPYIGTLALDLDVVDKLTLSAHGYLEVNGEGEGEATAAALLAGYELNYMVSAFAKYELFNLNGLGIGPVANYNSNFAPEVDRPALQARARHYPSAEWHTPALADRHHLRSGDVLVRPTGVGCQLGVG